MKSFHETDRYIYDLTPESVCLDCGGYEGFWATEMHKKYGCTVHVLEPVQSFFHQTAAVCQPFSKIRVYNFGIGAVTGKMPFSIKGSMTGPYADNPEIETVDIVAVEEVFARLPKTIDVMKLNIEGMEFQVVDSLIKSGLIQRIENLQVQWHPVFATCEVLFTILQQKLSETHQLTFDAQWIWQNWKKKQNS